MSKLEDAFLSVLEQEAIRQGVPIDPPRREYRFHPTRRWRFDFAWPRFRVAVEVDGGAFVRGRHVQGAGSHGDRNKLNAATLLGWRVLQYDVRHLRDDPATVFVQVLEALGAFDPCPPTRGGRGV
jgi:very-short-patch-repair endonuclease